MNNDKPLALKLPLAFLRREICPSQFRGYGAVRHPSNRNRGNQAYRHLRQYPGCQHGHGGRLCGSPRSRTITIPSVFRIPHNDTSRISHISRRLCAVFRLPVLLLTLWGWHNPISAAEASFTGRVAQRDGGHQGANRRRPVRADVEIARRSFPDARLVAQGEDRHVAALGTAIGRRGRRLVCQVDLHAASMPGANTRAFIRIISNASAIPSEFGYKDMLPLWKAEKWDPGKAHGALQAGRRALRHRAGDAPRQLRSVELEISAVERGEDRPAPRHPRRLEKGGRQGGHPLRHRLSRRLFAVVVSARIPQRSRRSAKRACPTTARKITTARRHGGRRWGSI